MLAASAFMIIVIDWNGWSTINPVSLFMQCVPVVVVGRNRHYLVLLMEGKVGLHHATPALRDLRSLEGAYKWYISL